MGTAGTGGRLDGKVALVAGGDSDIGLATAKRLVAGDATYNDAHLYLAESSPERRRDWLVALDTIESLRPRAVIAGHQRAGRHDGPELLEETRRYIRDFDRLAAQTSTARALKR